MHAVLTVLLCFSQPNTPPQCMPVHFAPPAVISAQSCEKQANAEFAKALKKAGPSKDGVTVEMRAVICGYEKDPGEK